MEIKRGCGSVANMADRSLNSSDILPASSFENTTLNNSSQQIQDP